MIARLVTVAVGIWLVVAPAVIDHSPVAADQVRTIGPIIASLAFVALWSLGQSVRWVNLPLGVWLILVPPFVDYGSLAALLNATAAGLVTVVTTPPARRHTASQGGGWRSLLHPSR